MWISLTADGVIALLLSVTIYYCYLVNKRLTALRSGKDELKGVIEGLTTATVNAQSSIEQLKNAGRDVIGRLDSSVTDGRALADELSLMIEAGNNLANRLEGGRQNAGRVGVTNVKVSAQPKRAAASRSQNTVLETPTTMMPQGPSSSEGLESELLKALRRAR